MRVRAKIILLLMLVFCLYFVANHLVWQWVVFPSFTELEQEQAKDDMRRCIERLRAELGEQRNTAAQWARSADLRDALRSGTTADLIVRVQQEMAAPATTDLLILISEQGRVLLRYSVDPVTREGIGTRLFPGDNVTPGHALHDVLTRNEPAEGVLESQRWPVLAAVYPVQPEGPRRGMVLVGRFLTDAMQTQFSRQFNEKLTIRPIGGSAVAPEDLHAVQRVTRAEPIAVHVAGGELLHAYTLLPDLLGHPSWLVRASIQRLITTRGMLAIRVATLSTLLAGVTLFIVIWLALQRAVVKPLHTLTEHAHAITQSGDLSARLHMRRADEIGELAGQFDAMLEHLKQSRTHALDAAHQAGMAQIATEVLHNVGNTLNSVNVSAEVLSEHLDRSRLVGLRKVLDLLAAHRDDLPNFFASDPRALPLLDYLTRLTDALGQEQVELRHEIRSLEEKIHHIKQIIRVQQDYAGGPKYAQFEELTGIVDDALDVHAQAMVRHGIEIQRDYPEQIYLTVNKVRLMQVLVNLFHNADEAMTQVSGLRRILVRVLRDDDDQARIEISDTGIGIEEDQLDRLFLFGYTSKAQGHGFGLHFCANAVHDMGGRIEARSEGRGQGATFTIYLPVESRPSLVMPQAAPSGTLTHVQPREERRSGPVEPPDEP